MKPWVLSLGLALSLSLSAEVPKASEFTFKVSPTRKNYATGRKDIQTDSVSPRSKQFLKADASYPGSLDLRKLYALTPIKDQGQCGSCVYFATTASFEDEHRIAGKPTPILSPQFLMDRVQWSCDGSIFEYVGGQIVKEGGVASLANYPYRASDQGARTPGQLYGSIKAANLIDNSAKSIVGALNTPHVVPTTVAASSLFMNYSSGIYNGCDSMSTNHEMEIVGYDCETSVDANGKCVFDSNGALPAGVGYWIVRNSWNTSFGEQGFIRIKMTDRSGRKCNNIADEVGVLETGLVPVVPIDGGFSDWSVLSACVNGQQSHSRSCTNPAPSNGGKDCVGPTSETLPCVVPVPPSPTAGFPWLISIASAVLGLLLGALAVALFKK